MKSLAFAGLGLVAALSFSACDPKPQARKEPAPAGSQPRNVKPAEGPSNPTIDPRSASTGAEEPTGPAPRTGGNVIPEPTPRGNPEYGVKMEGKPGYVKSPYDAAGRPIDVRGLPPGTEVEDPYTPGRTLLVP